MAIRRIGQVFVDLGFITIPEDIVRMDPVEVTGQAPLAVLKGDTSEFHAQAYKIAPDATAEDLVSELHSPGRAFAGAVVPAHGLCLRRVTIG